MKAGDQIPVTMQGFEVTYAIIEEIVDDKATLYIPPTRFVMGVATSLTPTTPETDRVMTGAEVAGTDESAASAEANEEAKSLRELNLDSNAVDA